MQKGSSNGAGAAANPSVAHVRSPQARLFVAVVQNAFSDALGHNGATKAERRAAVGWLLHDDVDFEAVCLFAGLDSVAVRSCARAFLSASGTSLVDRKAGGRHATPRLRRGTPDESKRREDLGGEAPTQARCSI